MSRSFERKVEKNRRKLQLDQKNKGIKPAGALGSRGEGVIYKGRNVLLPAFLVLLGVLYGVLGIVSDGGDVNYTLYVVTVALYFVLGVVVFLRKPYLRIHKNKLFTSKFNRDRSLDSGAIAKIKWSKNAITIVAKTKEPNWTFSRTRNFFNTEEMGATLQQFAATHGIELEKK
ncbi:hypothetical protein [Paenibacillus caui]|uniref:hypothetical protein n=1 Tax=Paenibacillus caui TaxID=2873927 RepID=UPI001CA85AF9|nr:hypothetical protein [Paenibacillus caui]